jgi:hypothetical protein
VVREPEPPSPLPASKRLADLRKRAKRLTNHKEAGDVMRRMLLDLGIEPWPPAWDLRWHVWIRRYGDERAREVLEIFYEALETRAEEIKAERAAGEQEKERG